LRKGSNRVRLIAVFVSFSGELILIAGLTQNNYPLITSTCDGYGRGRSNPI